MKSRNSREGYYAGFRVLLFKSSDRHQRTGPKVYPPMEALRYRHKESDQVFDTCSHIQDCPVCEGKGFHRDREIIEPCSNNCEEGKVWV